MSEKPTMTETEATLRKSVDAFDRGDFDSLITPYSQDAVFDTTRADLGVYEGREAIRGFLEDWRGSYDRIETAIEEFHDLGNGVTLAVTFQRARLSGSSGFVGLRAAWVNTWTSGLIERFAVYTDIDEGRAAGERLAKERK